MRTDGLHCHVADEGECLSCRTDQTEGLLANALEEPRRFDFLARAGWFGHCLGEVEKIVQTGRESCAIERYSSVPADTADSGEKGQDATVPETQLVRVERDPRRAPLLLQFRFNGTGGGKPVPQLPLSSEPDQEDIVFAPVDRHLIHLVCASLGIVCRHAGSGCRQCTRCEAVGSFPERTVLVFPK